MTVIFWNSNDNSWDKHKNLVDGIIQCLQGVTDESVYMLRVLNLHFWGNWSCWFSPVYPLFPLNYHLHSWRILWWSYSRVWLDLHPKNQHFNAQMQSTEKLKDAIALGHTTWSKELSATFLNLEAITKFKLCSADIQEIGLQASKKKLKQHQRQFQLFCADQR